MLEVLLWLDRFDLDGKQITTRRLRSLVENKQMPLRKVARVEYDGEPRRNPMGRIGKRNTSVLRKTALTDLLMLSLRLLNETLNGGTFQELCLVYSSLPARQLDDKRLESFRGRGCNTTQLRHDNVFDKCQVTEEGILAYCFKLDADVSMPERRSMEITSMNITPAFFKIIVVASKKSQLTCNVELCLDGLHFDVINLDLGVPPARSSEHDRDLDVRVHHVRYNFADRGNGIRLLTHFQRDEGDDEREVIICHGKKGTSAIRGRML